MIKHHEDLTSDLTKLRNEPPQWALELRESELARHLVDAAASFNAAMEGWARATADWTHRVSKGLGVYWSSYEGRKLRRRLRAFGLIGDPPSPLPRRKAHGRLRSRRELRDIRRRRRR